MFHSLRFFYSDHKLLDEWNHWKIGFRTWRPQFIICWQFPTRTYLHILLIVAAGLRLKDLALGLNYGLGLQHWGLELGFGFLGSWPSISSLQLRRIA